MSSIIVTSGVEGIVDDLHIYNEKIEILKRLAKKIDREMDKTLEQAWIDYTEGDDDCYETADHLRRLMNNIIPVTSGSKMPRSQRVSHVELREFDQYVLRYAQSTTNPHMLVMVPDFATFYPTHFWHDVLKRKGGVKELKEGEAVMFDIYEGNLTDCSCRFLS